MGLRVGKGGMYKSKRREEGKNRRGFWAPLYIVYIRILKPYKG